MKTKRFFALALCLVMLFTLLPAAFAEEAPELPFEEPAEGLFEEILQEPFELGNAYDADIGDNTPVIRDTPDADGESETPIVGRGDKPIQGDPVIPEGKTVEVNTIDRDENKGTVGTNQATIAINNGTVSTNEGTVKDNRKNVSTNKGTVEKNNGTVTTNDHVIDTNRATVQTNAEEGHLVVNDAGSVVKTNNGWIGRNYGFVIENNETVYTNYSTVTANNDFINSNEGTVTK